MSEDRAAVHAFLPRRVDFPTPPGQDEPRGGPGMSEPNTDFSQVPWITRRQIENRDRFPLEQLRPYSGKYGAGVWDFVKLLDSDGDWGRLWDRLAEMGCNPQLTPIEYIGE